MVTIEITVDQIDKYTFVVVDIRNVKDFKKNHFSNAINVPFIKLIVDPTKYLDKKKKYLLVCEYGIKSKKTSSILNNMGYNTYSLKGGMKK